MRESIDHYIRVLNHILIQNEDTNRLLEIELDTYLQGRVTEEEFEQRIKEISNND